MSDPRQPSPADPSTPDDAMAALPGESGIPDLARVRQRALSRKGLFAVALLVATLAIASVLSVQRWLGTGKAAERDSKRLSDRPVTAAGEPRRLELPSGPASAASSSSPAPRRVPALLVDAEPQDPIGIRRHAQPTDTPAVAAKATPPTDGATMIVAARPGTRASLGATPEGASVDRDAVDNGTRQRLDAYQRQLQGLLDTLTQSVSGSATTASAPAAATLAPFASPPPSAPPASTLFGGQLASSTTPRASAAMLGDRSLVLPRGTTFTCALKTRVVSATAGFVGCQVQRNVYSDDGHVLLVERGSHLDGEYRVTSIKPGTIRIPVIWSRIRTPNGVLVDIESPGTGALGEAGIDGDVDNRWPERIGAALLLSLIDDSVKLVVQSQQDERSGNTVVLPATTGSTSKLAEKVLDSTINIPPLLYRNQGGIVGIHVARDVDFSSVYQLKVVER